MVVRDDSDVGEHPKDEAEMAARSVLSDIAGHLWAVKPADARHLFAEPDIHASRDAAFRAAEERDAECAVVRIDVGGATYVNGGDGDGA